MVSQYEEYVFAQVGRGHGRTELLQSGRAETGGAMFRRNRTAQGELACRGGEMADTLGLGPSSRKAVEVRILSPAEYLEVSGKAGSGSAGQILSWAFEWVSYMLLNKQVLNSH